MSVSMAQHRPGRGRPRRQDVVFYTPDVGLLISDTAPNPPGGAEWQVLMLAKALAREGLRVGIIVFGSAGDLPTEVDGVRIFVRRPSGKSRTPAGRVAEAGRIWNALRRAPSRVVVQRGYSADLGLTAVYARLTRRRFVFASANVVDFDYQRLQTLFTKKIYFAMYLLGVRLANQIVVQTEEQVKLCRASFGRRPVLVQSMEPLPANPPQPVPEAFLWVGRLVTYKKPLAYVDLARAIPEAKFWMIGVPAPKRHADETLGQTVRAEARDIANLELLAPRRHDDILALMPYAVASVSTGEFEGMPNVLLEAWSLGVPALVLNHDPGGVVTRYELGYFANGSPARLAEQARELWATRNDRQVVSRRCRSYIQQNHSPEAVAREWLKVLSTPRGTGE